MKLKYIPPKKLKVLTGMFFGAGALGIIMGLNVGGVCKRKVVGSDPIIGSIILVHTNMTSVY